GLLAKPATENLPRALMVESQEHARPPHAASSEPPGRWVPYHLTGTLLRKVARLWQVDDTAHAWRRKRVSPGWPRRPVPAFALGEYEQAGESEEMAMTTDSIERPRPQTDVLCLASAPIGAGVWCAGLFLVSWPSWAEPLVGLAALVLCPLALFVTAPVV